jgi:hypothetical protein
VTKATDKPFLDLDAVEGDGEPVESSCVFKLGGREWECRQPEEVPFGVIKSLVIGSETAEGTITQVDDFFRATLVPEQVDDFLAMLDNKETAKTLTMGKLKPLMEFVAEQVLNRPTEPPAPSRAVRRAAAKR